MSDTVLAYRIYPKPQGTSYYEEDLLDEQKVLELFDYCQILEASIFKEGWEFLIKQFGIEKLFELNQISGWLDVNDLSEFRDEVYSQIDK